MNKIYEFLEVSTEANITEIRLNRPDKLNALNTGMLLELREALLFSKKDRNTHVIVLSGSGKAFSSGADISEFKEKNNSVEHIRDRASLTMGINAMFQTLGKPVIASVHNYVLAGGCGLAMAADLVVASEDAVFAYPEIQRGFVAALVMTNLTRLVGRRNAFDMLITGRKVYAKEALQMGLINKVVPREELEGTTRELAESISKNSPVALQMTKELFYRVTEMNFQQALESAKDMNSLMRMTNDFNKGVEEFISQKTNKGS